MQAYGPCVKLYICLSWTLTDDCLASRRLHAPPIGMGHSLVICLRILSENAACGKCAAAATSFYVHIKGLWRCLDCVGVTATVETLLSA